MSLVNILFRNTSLSFLLVPIVRMRYQTSNLKKEGQSIQITIERLSMLPPLSFSSQTYFDWVSHYTFVLKVVKIFPISLNSDILYKVGECFQYE